MNYKFIIFTIGLIAFFSFAAKAQTEKADSVILNANVRTMDDKLPRAEAVAIAGNKIIAVGTNDEIHNFIGENTKKIDAEGRLVLPGFNDGHVHFIAIGNKFTSVDLREVKTPEEFVEKLNFYARFLPKGNWILGSGWKTENWTPAEFPSKELIDAVTPNNPVFVYNSDASEAFANTLALDIAKLNEIKPDSKDDLIERDSEGKPTGIIKGGTVDVVKFYTPKSPQSDKAALAETASNYAASLGITSVQDMSMYEYHVDLYRKLYEEGRLKTRIYDCLAIPDWQKLADAGIQHANGDAIIRNGCVKGFYEGNPANLAKLYTDISAADKANLQVMIHAIGGEANHQILPIFERVTRENGKKDRRMRVEHAYGVRPLDVKRFANSKIIASMQPFLFFGGSYNFRSFLGDGIRIAFGSDAPIGEFNPLLGIYAAVSVPESSPNLVSAKPLSVEEAVRLYTTGAAYAEFQENVKGTISVGKYADLIILSDDIFSISPDEIRKTKVLTTILAGKIIYQTK